MKALGDVLDPLIDELGDAPDFQYLNHPQWTKFAAGPGALATR